VVCLTHVFHHNAEHFSLFNIQRHAPPPLNNMIRVIKPGKKMLRITTDLKRLFTASMPLLHRLEMATYHYSILSISTGSNCEQMQSSRAKGEKNNQLENQPYQCSS
jgi:hypothetical protein